MLLLVRHLLLLASAQHTISIFWATCSIACTKRWQLSPWSTSPFLEGVGWKRFWLQLRPWSFWICHLPKMRKVVSCDFAFGHISLPGTPFYHEPDKSIRLDHFERATDFEWEAAQASNGAKNLPSSKQAFLRIGTHQADLCTIQHLSLLWGKIPWNPEAKGPTTHLAQRPTRCCHESSRDSKPPRALPRNNGHPKVWQCPRWPNNVPSLRQSLCVVCVTALFPSTFWTD